uniref:Ribokinase n=1 Tax=Parascaris univalens TaxID=6257 RepID=A0A915BD78_PARUN
MADIVVFGSIVHDLISYTEVFPRPGESVRGLSFESGPGGKGANQAAQAARLGGNVLIIARVGNDSFGSQNINALKGQGVNIDYVEKSDTVGTATAMVTVSQHGENSIVVTLGANLELSEARAEELESVIAKAKIFLCQYEIKVDALRKALEVAKRNNVRTFFNFAPAEPTFDKSILKYVDILCTNENETEFASGMSAETVEDALKAAQSLLSFGPSAVIATLGKNGSVIATKDGILKHVETRPVKAVDTTGAGDSFCGALAYFIVTKPELSLEEQVRRASCIAAVSVQHKGTQASYPWAKDLPADLFE